MNKEASSIYRKLEEHFRRLNHIDGVMAMLHWDMSTMMPVGGAEARSNQLAELTSIRHQQLTDPILAGLISNVDGTMLDDWQAANLREMRRIWDRGSALTDKLATAHVRAISACEIIWREARRNNDFLLVAPMLDDVLHITREIAAARADVLTCTPYDALLDNFDPELRSTEIDIVFSDLENFLPPFIERAQKHQRSLALPVPIIGPFPINNQKGLCEGLIDVVGFERNHGRVDISHHPFTGGVPDDVRITTRYKENDFSESMMGLLHEVGHAFYERGLPHQWRDQPVGQSRGMTLHESQSLLMEMHACRSSEFIIFLAPLLADAFNGEGRAWEADNLHRLYTHIEPNLIRVEADEATYPLHIILRYQLERALLNGDLGVADLPEAWSTGMQDVLGIKPVDDRDGCMQDIHWYAGDFGYFPSYTLGALAAAQFFSAAKEIDPGIMPAIAKGSFRPLLSWLRHNIHSQGSLHSTQELITKATGAQLTTDAYKRHLAARYLA